MSPFVALLALRILLAVLLYAFIGGLFYLLWRDVRRAAAEALERDRAQGRLVVVASSLPAPSTGESYPLLPITSLGRGPTNSIALPDDTASLEHALVTLRSGKWWLEDLGSRNGTSLNGQPITAPTVISAGDVIGLGRVSVRVEIEGP